MSDQQTQNNSAIDNAICQFGTKEHHRLEAPVKVCYYNKNSGEIELTEGKNREFPAFYYLDQSSTDNYQNADSSVPLKRANHWASATAADFITLMDFWWIYNKKQMTVATEDQIQQFYASDGRNVSIDEGNKRQFLSGIRQCAQSGSLENFETIRDELNMHWLPANVQELLIMATDTDYLTEISNNYDHFYPHALFCYKAGHELAIDMMKKAKAAQDDDQKEQLVTFATQLEAYAQHAFSDCYAGGHLIINPNIRKRLKQDYDYLGPIVDMLINAQHNNGNRYGIVTRIKDRQGKTHYPVCYGDGHLNEPENQRAMQLCREGLNLGYQQLKEAYDYDYRPQFEAIRGYFPHVLSQREYKAEASKITDYFGQYKSDFGNKSADKLYQQHKPIASLLRLNKDNHLEILQDPSDLNPHNAVYVPLTCERILSVAWRIMTGTFKGVYKENRCEKVMDELDRLIEKEQKQLDEHSHYNFFFLRDRVRSKHDFLSRLKINLKDELPNRVVNADELSGYLIRAIDKMPARDMNYWHNVKAGIFSHRVYDFLKQYGALQAIQAKQDKNQAPRAMSAAGEIK